MDNVFKPAVWAGKIYNGGRSEPGHGTVDVTDKATGAPIGTIGVTSPADVAGAGQWRGGVAAVRGVESLEPLMLSGEGDGNACAPWSAFGGLNGSPCGLEPLDQDGSIDHLPANLRGSSAQRGGFSSG
jgi:hypothetical protein